MRPPHCPPRRSPLVGATLALLCVLAPPPAAAADAPAAPAADTVVLLIARGQEAWLGSGDAFRAQLSDLPVTLRVESVGRLPAVLGDQLALARAAADRAGARVVFWLDRPGAVEVLLVVTDPAAPRLVVRRLDGDPDAAAGSAAGHALVETAAVAARTELRALLGDAPADEGAAAAPGTPPRAEVQVGYGLDVWGSDTLFHGVALRPAVRPLPWLSVALAARIGPGVVVRGELGDLAVTRWPLSLEAGWRLALSPRWRMELALGPALEVVQVRADPLPLGWRADPDGTTVLFGVTLGASVSLRLVAGVHLALAVATDALFPDTDWSFRSAGDREEVAQPWFLRPRLALSLAFDVP